MEKKKSKLQQNEWNLLTKEKVSRQELENQNITNKEIQELIQHQVFPKEEELNVIKYILESFSHRGSVYAAVCAFQYGVIQGKRIERRKRNDKSIKKQKAPIIHES